MLNEKISIIDPLQDERWDQFVAKHPNGWLCHLSGWKALLERCFSHIKGFYIVKVNDVTDEICAGLPIFRVNSFLTAKRLVSIPFTTLCDPLYNQENDLQEMIERAIEMSEKDKSSFIEIRSFKSARLKNDRRFKTSIIYKNHYLELKEDIESIKKRLHRTCVKQRISRSLKSNITLKFGKTGEDLERFYSLYLITRKRTQLPPMPYHFFETMWEIFQPSGKISLLLAEHHDAAIAALLLFKYKNRVSIEFAGSDDTYKTLSPNHFLFWHAINISKEEGYAVLDFGRTSPNNQHLMDFKSHWGTLISDIPHYYYFRNSRNQAKYPENTFDYILAQTLSRFIPNSLYPAFGKFCYRHLG